jgi:hypothetical protein
MMTPVFDFRDERISLIPGRRSIVAEQYQVVVAARERESQPIAILEFCARCNDALGILLETQAVQYAFRSAAKLKDQEF